MTMLDWTRNPALEEELYARLRRKYEHARPEIHFSDVTHCLTMSYWGKTNPIPFSNDTWGLFAIGFALEEVLLKEPPTLVELQTLFTAEFRRQEEFGFIPSAEDFAIALHEKLTASQTASYEYEGLHFSPDYTTTAIAGEMDLKTTRMWSEDDGRPKYVEDRPNGFPDGWLKQFMGYAHRLGAQPANDITPVDYVDYSVAILYLGAGKLIAGTIRFAWDDVEENMALALYRASILEDQLKQQEPPVPFMYNEAWECKNCAYFSRCKSYE